MSIFRRTLLSSALRGAKVANVGDVAYKASDGSIKVVNPDEWSSSLGTPVGVVVIPSGFAPDNGKARITALYYVDENGEPNYYATHVWSNSYRDTLLPNYGNVVVTDKNSFQVDMNNAAYLPSDMFTGVISTTDSIAKYFGGSIGQSGITENFIPSPYLGDKPNPAYYAEISGGNALSDFNGKSNTDTLVALGADYVAANAARNYKVEGAEEIEWYLPAMGEIGYYIVRLKSIGNTLNKFSEVLHNDTVPLHTSTEREKYFAWFVTEGNGIAFAHISYEFLACYVRPFAQLDF